MFLSEKKKALQYKTSTPARHVPGIGLSRPFVAMYFPVVCTALDEVHQVGAVGRSQEEPQGLGGEPGACLEVH